MAEDWLSFKKVCQILGDEKVFSEKLILAENAHQIPPQTQNKNSNPLNKLVNHWQKAWQMGWTMEQAQSIIGQFGFFKKFNRPVALTVFTTKGGVLKSTLALNLARVAALHGQKTCVVGLDMQLDITTALGYEDQFGPIGQNEKMADILKNVDQTKGLFDLFQNHVRLEDIICPTSFPNLFLIPETPELVLCNEGLSNLNRREYWLKEKVIDQLKKEFDVVILDCSPNWNKLTTNALVACDFLLSPLECKINNFRNFKIFQQFLSQFKSEMKLDFPIYYLPTKFAHNRKLSLEIKDWYQQNVPGCLSLGLREGVHGEEAVALNLSLVEYQPNKPMGIEMREILTEIHLLISQHFNQISHSRVDSIPTKGTTFSPHLINQSHQSPNPENVWPSH
jgi:chromosome partitioning protein